MLITNRIVLTIPKDFLFSFNKFCSFNFLGSIQVIINKPKDHRLIKIHHKQQLTQCLDFSTQLGLPNQPRIPLVKGISPNFGLFVNYDGWDPLIIIHYQSHDAILEVSGCNHGHIAGLYEVPNYTPCFYFQQPKWESFGFSSVNLTNFANS